MKTIPARNTYLSGTVTPLVRTTLRRLRLDFGSELYFKNDGGAIGGSSEGDDYNDPAGTSGVIWGDSTVTDDTAYKVRVVAAAAWTSGGSTSMWRDRTGGVGFGMSSLTAPTTLHGYCRPGIYPVASTDDVYVWFVSSGGSLYRYTLDTDLWTFGSGSSGLSLSSHTSCAVHPVSATKAVVVAYTAPYLWGKVCTYSGSWSSSSDWVIHMSDELNLADAHWSDAVVSPDDSSKVVVALNLSRWGSAHTALFDTTSELWSQPREMLPSAQEWGNLKVRCSGMTVIDSRIWAVTTREPVASDDIPMAHHVALASSTNGTDWADEYYITQSTLRGKLIHGSDEGYCYVVGNASVARGEASYRLGYDNSSLKHTVVEGWGLEANYSGVGAAPEISVTATNTSDTLSGTGLLEAGNELAIEVGADGESYGDYCKALLSAPSRSEQWFGDEITLQGYGYSGRILGGDAYLPIAAKNYQNPWSLYSNFNFASGAARQTLRQVSGTWNTAGLWELGRNALYCSVAGIALLPYKLLTQAFLMRISFKAKVSIEGNFIVFWYEDVDNYWRAGLYLDGSTQKIVIQRYVDGVLSTKASDTVSVSVGNWYALYVDARPGVVRMYFNGSDSYSFGSTYLSYSTTPETGIPVEHHIGLECEGFLSFEGAFDRGIVSSSTATTITDSGAPFGSYALGMWLRCNDQDRQVIDYTSTTLTVSTPWASNPTAGQEYGLYTSEAINGPGMYVKEVFACEARVPWSVDDIINNMLALCGVARSDVFTGGTVGTISSSSPTAWDVDMKIVSSSSSGSGVFWCSTPSSYSGLRVAAGSGAVSLTEIDSGVDGTTDLHPSLITMPSSSREIRIQAGRDVIVVSCDGHFVSAFPSKSWQTGGYMARVTGTSCTTTEFPEMADLIWDANETAASAFQRLLQGRRAKLAEREDGSMAVSRFYNVRGIQGPYTTPLVSKLSGDRGIERAGITEMVGAEKRAFYLDPEAARYRLNFVRADNPTLMTQDQTLREARRLAQMGRQRASAIQVQLYIADPGAELEDRFTVGGTDYVVDGCQFSIKLGADGTPEAAARIAGRATASSVTTGTYGSATYDGSTEYGG